MDAAKPSSSAANNVTYAGHDTEHPEIIHYRHCLACPAKPSCCDHAGHAVPA